MKTRCIHPLTAAALALAGMPSLAHDGHGLVGGHWHATDGWGLVGLAVVVAATWWLARGGKP